MKRSWMLLTLAALLTGGLTLAGCSGSDAEAEDTASAGTAMQNEAGGAETYTAQNTPADDGIAAAEIRKGAQPAVDTSALRDAPAWRLPDLNGGTVSSAQFAGKVIILDFWATWCGPCKMEIPHFIELQNTYGDKLAVIGVDMGEPKEKVLAFATANNINYQMVLGSQQIANDYAPIKGLPTTFVLSQDGKIYKRYVGYRPKQVFERDIAALLGE